MTKRNKKRVIVSILVVVLLAALVFGVILPYRHKTKAPASTTTSQETNINNEAGSVSGTTQNDSFDQKDVTPSTNDANSASPTSPVAAAPSDSSNPNDSADSFYYLALKNTADKNYSEAIINFSKAIGIDPKQADYYSKKAEAQVSTGDKNGAIATVEAGLVALPGNELLQNKLDIINATVK